MRGFKSIDDLAEKAYPVFEKLALQWRDKHPVEVALFSRSAMKDIDANIRRGNESMNQALLDRADVKRGMYRNDLGWIDFVWGDDAKGLQHIIKSRMERDGLTTSEVYRLLTNDIVETIADGETVRRSDANEASRLAIRGKGNEAILVRQNGGNGWLLTGFELKEPMNQTRGATPSGLRSNAPIRSRGEEVAALDSLSTLARQNVNNNGSPPVFSRASILNSQIANMPPNWPASGLTLNAAPAGRTMPNSMPPAETKLEAAVNGGFAAANLGS